MNISRYIQATIYIVAATFFSEPSKAHHRVDIIECNSYHITESYEPGGLNSSGFYERGSITTNRNRIPCNPSGWESAHYSPHHHAPTAYPYPVQQQQQPIQSNRPTVVNVQQNQCEGKLLRMGLGAIGGGFAGRYAVGGKKSNKTLLGTTLGAMAGSLIGRATC